MTAPATTTWTGRDGETVIDLPTGDPVANQQNAHDQITRYLRTHDRRDWSEFTIVMAAQLIADYHIKDGTHPVTLTREHLYGYLAYAVSKLTDRAELEPDPRSGW